MANGFNFNFPKSKERPFPVGIGFGPMIVGTSAGVKSKDPVAKLFDDLRNHKINVCYLRPTHQKNPDGTTKFSEFDALPLLNIFADPDYPSAKQRCDQMIASYIDQWPDFGKFVGHLHQWFRSYIVGQYFHPPIYVLMSNRDGELVDVDGLFDKFQYAGGCDAFPNEQFPSYLLYTIDIPAFRTWYKQYEVDE